MNASSFGPRTRVGTVALLLVAAHANAQRAPTEAPRLPASVLHSAETIQVSRLEQDLRYLASDALLGRANPSAGLDTAAAYISRRLAQLGLRPFGDDGTYLEPVAFTTYRPDSACAYASVRGERFGFPADFGLPGDRQNRVRFRPQAASGSGRIVYVQHGFVSRSLGIDPYAHVDVRGAVVVVSSLGDARKWFEAVSAGRSVTDIITPDVAAAVRGAIAMIVVPSWDDMAGWQHSRGQRLRTTIIPSPWVPASTTRIQKLNASPELLDALFAGEAYDASHVVAATLTQNLTPSFALDSTKIFASDLCLRTIAAKVSNVFAVIEGSDPALKNRYVVIGAHYDGQGLDRPIHGDSIKNAADDNASGSAAVLAIAEALARGPRPKRSIVLAWFAAEEIGLGAPYHLRHKPDQTLATDLAVILDMVGRPDAGIHTVNGSTSELLDRAMAINRSYLGIELRASPAGEDGGSDDGSYKNHSRPFLLYADDGFLAPGVVEAVADKHTVTDQAEKIDFALLQRLTRTVYVTAWMFANEGLPR